MTTLEFNQEFDILWDNIMSNQAPSLSNYEKSVFLTQGQETYVKSVYDSFEEKEKQRSYISTLVKQITMLPDTDSKEHIVGNSKFYRLPKVEEHNLMFIVYEGARTTKSCDKDVIVKPVTHDMFWEVYNNPFKGANGNRVLRIIHQENNNVFELISKDNITKYIVRYVERPTPIIISDPFAQGLTIEGFAADGPDMECKLPEIVHRDILQVAVTLAQSAWFTQKK